FWCLTCFSSCGDNSSDPNENNSTQFWSHPGRDAIELSFDLNNAIEIDSLLAGRIQYALDRARKIDNDLVDFHIKYPVSLHEIQIYCERRLYERFDERSKSFGIVSLDNFTLPPSPIPGSEGGRPAENSILFRGSSKHAPYGITSQRSR
ncbi:hypothetical protein K8I28_00215, partial [bacterium]|nr:hypothetical protein [bacterium]